MTDNVTPLKDVTFGAISGILSKVVEYPFDTVKVRLQANPETKSTWDVICTAYKNEGIVKGFYQGIKAPMAGACVENATLFFVYGLSSSALKTVFYPEKSKNPDMTNPLWISCLSGGASGFAASFFLTPLELVKCKLQVANVKNRAESARLYTATIKYIIQHDGVFGLWNGLSATLLREIGGTAVWFGAYEFMNSSFCAQNESKKLTDLQLIASGAMAGICFHVSFFPADTVKSNIQTLDILHGGEKSVNSFQVAKILFSRPGSIRNFYRGLPITLARAIPSNAIIFYTYELLKRNF